MPSPIPSRRTRLERGSLLLLLITVSLALIWILLPFYGAILWSIVISLLFAPVQSRLRSRLHMRATPAALLTLSMVVLIGILPVLLISLSLTNEVAGLYLRMQAGEANPMPYLRGLFDALPADVIGALKRLGLGDFASLQRHLNESLTKISQFLATRAYSFGQNIDLQLDPPGLVLPMSLHTEAEASPDDHEIKSAASGIMGTPP
ncbi:AI-2E family transporter, partial [Roseateles sp.]|uniref:AI-2E family transporter n=1 Tax=Roseateles sp. TaxID=1971397 RepID=UPI0039DF727C